MTTLLFLAIFVGLPGAWFVGEMYVRHVEYRQASA